ncbi:two pore domain potassium channel family protein [Salinimicrobium tongyeongense]|uniref:Two pore domain potassium channel family protein n=1 Tax=Salinimicrobium tongyeongense TaxID=2809707 RepID=A0ABY6NQG1_9FLAO|nr:potassium channel family protein [Salinimicrobium tongyeongense]UZH54811.1 two pore domain potassium channel family protein [Salinimicrobium tongyeongense]
MQTVQIVIGLAIILFTYLDFFHTTLSGNGFGIFSRIINQILNRIMIQNRSRSIFKFSGITHLLLTTFLWMLLLFIGTYAVFSAEDSMVVNGTTGVPATVPERFYYTGYVLSTLGVGDFVPGTDTSRVLTGILSFSGFILITTGLTYLLSVINAVLEKKQLSFLISTMGKDVEEIFNFYKQQEDLENLISNAGDLRQQILQNASSYLAFPMANYFLSKNHESALILQLARLHEVIMIIRLDWRQESVQYKKLTAILNGIKKYLELGLEDAGAAKHNEEELKTYRSYWMKHGYYFKNEKAVDEQFSSSLKYAGWNWKEVYKLKEEE